MREHIGGIYDYLSQQADKFVSQQVNKLVSQQVNKQTSRQGDMLSQQVNKSNLLVDSSARPSSTKEDYAARKEQQKLLRKARKAVEDSEARIACMEGRLKELDALLSQPENASDMTLVTEYTDTKRALDEEVERWERLAEEEERIG